jgi:hypothetical protein
MMSLNIGDELPLPTIAPSGIFIVMTNVARAGPVQASETAP